MLKQDTRMCVLIAGISCVSIAWKLKIVEKGVFCKKCGEVKFRPYQTGIGQDDTHDVGVRILRASMFS